MSHPDPATAPLGVDSRASDVFLSALSHELRTPLTPILLALQSLARRNDLPEAVRAALAMIRRNVIIESRLIDNLLDFASIVYGRFEVDSQPMDLHAAVHGAIEACMPEIDAKQHTLTVALDASHYAARGDAGRLRHVVCNLLSNAATFTPAGGAIRIGSSSEGDWFVLSVSDNGAGMNPDTLHRAFDPLRSEDERMKRAGGGLGLGLAICQATVEAHGGTIRAESAGAGRGTTLTVQLPLTDDRFAARP